MGEHEPANPRLPRDACGLAGGGVSGAARPLRFVRAEGGFVDEEICLFGSLDGVAGGAGVAGINDEAPRAGRSHDFAWVDAPAVDLDRLTAVELPPERPLRNPQLARTHRVEAAQARALADRITHTARPVRRAEGNDLVCAPVDRLSRLHPDDGH